MEILRKFEELKITDVNLAGGKGASLGEMSQAGIPVPPGFVVLADAFDGFIELAGLKADIEAILDDVNKQDTNSVEEASEKIRAMIAGAEFPADFVERIMSAFDVLGAEYVAVRSSATAEDGVDASWAGELESYLNTTREDLLVTIQKCWSSLFTPRAIFYRFEKGFVAHVSVAVVVQKMVQSEVSGICFTVHPVTEDPNQLIIEAGYGLGEAIVGGMITPDSYVIDKTTNEFIDRYISSQEKKIIKKATAGIETVEVEADAQEKQKLPDEVILKLAGIAKKIEQHYGKPQDIEWAWEGGELYIVQSRPITTL